MRKTIIKGMLFYCLCMLLMGCGPSKFSMRFHSYNNPDISYSEYKKFAFLPTDTEFPLKEKQLFQYIRGVMEHKGFIFDEEHPQFLISVKTSERLATEVRPVKSRRVSTYKPAPIGSNVNNYGTWQTSHETTGGGSTTFSTLFLVISMIDAAPKNAGANSVYIWQGQASSSQKVKMKAGGMRGGEKCLITGILQEYPNVQQDKMLYVLPEQCF